MNTVFGSHFFGGSLARTKKHTGTRQIPSNRAVYLIAAGNPTKPIKRFTNMGWMTPPVDANFSKYTSINARRVSRRRKEGVLLGN